ncbi:S-layer homology domain-containing protein [Serpentinicella alkaliphila]|uniref:S-layer family protein n=1 Tax=Serpentinicella alkaliphila TaxID=1734049 RepID=A0A4R2THB9_9FIRM|nr:S-layer homology domain-containing protein [Serpentinicella alkaliphila]QUH26003.1 S-layer homology domain-containing protein [Serpentinicella alkaliphila]TCQ02136.1 S-layer family protein [Serpentinicella alkaliphila]
MLKKATILLVIILFFSLCLSYAQYLDIDNHWSADSVYWATNDVKIFKGYPDGTFRPEEHITRAQYIALLNRILESKNGYTNNNADTILSYIDIDNTHWAYKEIEHFSSAIDSLGFANISLEDIFIGNRLYPNRKISRFEAAILTRAITTPPIYIQSNKFDDIPVNIRFFNELSELVNNGIILGFNNKFRPYDYVTRAESATIIKRIYNDLDYVSNNILTVLPIEEKINKNYPLFSINLNGGQLSIEDRLFIDAITSLEYKEFIGFIPFEEQHLYDLTPIKTLWELKQKKYKNLLGVNYYILKYDNSINDVNKADILEETLSYYVSVDESFVDGIYNLLLYAYENIEYVNIDLLKNAIEKFYTASHTQEKIYSGVLLSIIHYKLNNIKEAKEIHTNLLNTDNLDIRLETHLALNKTYLEYKASGKSRALEYLEDIISELRENRQFSMYSDELDSNYTSFKKQLLMEP